MIPMDRIAVTTSARGGHSQVVLAQRLAHDLDVPFMRRMGRSLEAVAEAYSEDGRGKLEAFVVAEASRISVVRLEDAGRPHAELFFHPGMALSRIRRLRNGGTDQMVEAMGLARGDQVLDCTVGLGSDAIVSSWVVGNEGRVVGVEVSPVLAVVTREGLASYTEADPDALRAMRRVEIVCENHLDYLKGCPPISFDVVSFDPMFREPVTTSAGIAPMRPWASHEPLSEEALAEGVRVARRRVVIKDRVNGDDLDRLGVGARVGAPKSRQEYGVIRLDEDGMGEGGSSS